MSVLDDVIGLDFWLVKQHLKHLRAIDPLPVRRAYLKRVEAEDGARIRELTEAAFAEEWARRKEEAHG